MKEQVKKFLQKLDQDGTLKNKFTETQNQEELAAVIKEAGFTFKPEEYRLALKELQKEAGIEQITDDNLEQVAGGLCSPICSPVNLCNPTCGNSPGSCDPHCKPHWRECGPQCSPDCNPK